MDMLNEKKFEGKKVNHCKFGEGTVTGYERKTEIKSYIKVRFSGKECEFDFFECVKNGVLTIPDYDLLQEFYRIKNILIEMKFNPPPTPPTPPTPSGVLRVGDTWLGNSNADMINKVLGTDYKQYMRCTVKLKSIDRAPTAAWFVYMDGSEHSGWRNNISADGLTITERYVGNDFQYFKNAELNQYPVAFMLDPDGSGLKYARYKCRFMGVYRLIDCDEAKRTRTYKRISDTYKIQLKNRID